MRPRREATRSFSPSPSTCPVSPAESATSSRASRASRAAGPVSRSSAPTAVARLSAAEMARTARRTRRRAAASSRDLASHTVQVASEAMARPIITVFTTMSAAANMPQGDRSRGSLEGPSSMASGIAPASPGTTDSPAAAAAPSVVGAGCTTVAGGWSWAPVATACPVTAATARMNTRSARIGKMTVLFRTGRGDGPVPG